MKKKIKILLMITVLLAALCAFAFSTPAAEFTASGACGDGVTWTLDAQGALTVSGSGAMDEFGPAAAPPWKNHKADIQTVTVEAGVTGVGSYAFAGCPALQTVALADSVISIGSHAFENSGVASIDMSDNVQSIGSCAFMECRALTSVDLPKPLVSLGGRAFYNCDALTEMRFGAQNMNDITGVTDIFCNAGAESGFTLIFTDTVERIPSGLFHTYTNLLPNVTDIVIGKNITTIANYAFIGCPKLRSFDAPADGALRTIGVGAFENCEALESAVLPASVTRIKEKAFAGCVNLGQLTVYSKKLKPLAIDTFAQAGENTDGVRVIFADGVTKIPENMFYCTEEMTAHITDVQAGKDIAVIEPSAFRSCVYLTTFTLADDSALETIDSYAFQNCSSLKEIVLPAKLTKLGREAFYNCTGLTSITYRCASLARFSAYANVFYCAGREADGITVTFEAPAKKIPDNLFMIPDLFDDTTVSPKIVSVFLNKEMEDIGVSAFYGLTEMKTFSIPDGSALRSIQDEAFYGCMALDAITLPEELEYVYYHAFYNCRALREIRVKSRRLNAFDSSGNTFANAGVHVSELKVIFEDTVEGIPDYMFAGSITEYPFITEIQIGSSVKTIGQQAFLNCRELCLAKFSKDNMLSVLGEQAFENCRALNMLYFYNCDCRIPDNKGVCGTAGNTTIYGYAESTAEKYADAYGFRFIQLNSTLPGDIDNNGKLTAADARLALRASVGLENFPVNSRSFTMADVDRSGSITAADARLILRAVVQLEDLTALFNS